MNRLYSAINDAAYYLISIHLSRGLKRMMLERVFTPHMLFTHGLLFVTTNQTSYRDKKNSEL